MAANEKPNEDTELPHITLDPRDEIITQDPKRGFTSFNSKPVDKDNFRNMLGEAISVGTVITSKFRNTYFLVDLTTEYYSPAVSDMLESLGLNMNTVLSETQILVTGDEAKLKQLYGNKDIPKKITNPIKRLRTLSYEEKVGADLLRAIKEDVDRTRVFPISIRLLDNLKKEEEDEFNKILQQEMKNELNPRFLNYSKQYICGSSSKRIIEFSKIPFIQKITQIPKIQPQQLISDRIFAQKGKYSIIPHEDVPTICIIDSGVSNTLSKLCSFTDAFIFKEPFDTIGHGTKVISVNYLASQMRGS